MNLVKLKRIGSDPITSLVFVFHHCGGDGSSFRDLAKALTTPNNGVGVYLVILPGRALSQKSQLLTSIPAAADQVFTRLKEEVDKNQFIRKVPVTFFGHSMGGILAYEVIRRLSLTVDSIRVRHLIVSSVRSPDGLTHMNMRAASDPKQCPDWLIHQRSEEGVLDHLRDLNGGALGVDPRFVLNKLHAIRADFEAFETYVNCNVSGDQGLGAWPLRIPCDITALWGLDDAKVPREEVLDWSRFTGPGCDFSYTQFDGGHFYLFDEKNKDVVATKLHDLSLGPLMVLPPVGEGERASPSRTLQPSPQEQEDQKLEPFFSPVPAPRMRNNRVSTRGDEDVEPVVLPPLSPFVTALEPSVVVPAYSEESSAPPVEPVVDVPPARRSDKVAVTSKAEGQAGSQPYLLSASLTPFSSRKEDRSWDTAPRSFDSCDSPSSPLKRGREDTDSTQPQLKFHVSIGDSL